MQTTTANTANQVQFSAKVASLEDRANARLIAAAPDLLAACQSLVVECGEARPGTTLYDYVANARAAIAKATQ